MSDIIFKFTILYGKFELAIEIVHAVFASLWVHSFDEYQRMQGQRSGGYSLLFLLSHLSIWTHDHLLLTFIVSSEVLLLILIDTLHILHHLLLLTGRQHFVVAFLTAHIAAVGPSLRLLALGATLLAFLFVILLTVLLRIFLLSLLLFFALGLFSLLGCLNFEPLVKSLEVFRNLV